MTSIFIFLLSILKYLFRFVTCCRQLQHHSGTMQVFLCTFTTITGPKDITVLKGTQRVNLVLHNTQPVAFHSRAFSNRIDRSENTIIPCRCHIQLRLYIPITWQPCSIAWRDCSNCTNAGLSVQGLGKSSKHCIAAGKVVLHIGEKSI